MGEAAGRGEVVAALARSLEIGVGIGEFRVAELESTRAEHEVITFIHMNQYWSLDASKQGNLLFFCSL